MNDTFATAASSRVGARVLYMLSEPDARDIFQKRRQAGWATKTGNEPREGQVVPGIIVADWYHPLTASQLPDAELTEEKLAALNAERQAASSVNIQVFLDGDDGYWVTSRSMWTESTGAEYMKSRWVFDRRA